MRNRAGQILRERRLELGLTQEEVALELHMSIHQYQRYEYGEHQLSNCPIRPALLPTLRGSLRRWAFFINFSPKYVCADVDKPPTLCKYGTAIMANPASFREGGYERVRSNEIQ